MSLKWAALVSQHLEEVQAPLPGGQEAQEHTRLSFATPHTAVDFGSATSSDELIVVSGGWSAGPLLHPRADEEPVAPIDEKFNDDLMATTGISLTTINESMACTGAIASNIRGRSSTRSRRLSARATSHWWARFEGTARSSMI